MTAMTRHLHDTRTAGTARTARTAGGAGFGVSMSSVTDAAPRCGASVLAGPRPVAAGNRARQRRDCLAGDGGPLRGPLFLVSGTGTVHRISRYTGCKPAFGGRSGRKLLPRGTGRPRLRRDSIEATLHVASALFRVNSLSVYAPSGCILLRCSNDGSYPVTGDGLVATTGRTVL